MIAMWLESLQKRLYSEFKGNLMGIRAYTDHLDLVSEKVSCYLLLSFYARIAFHAQHIGNRIVSKNTYDFMLRHIENSTESVSKTERHTDSEQKKRMGWLGKQDVRPAPFLMRRHTHNAAC